MAAEDNPVIAMLEHPVILPATAPPAINIAPCELLKVCNATCPNEYSELLRPTGKPIARMSFIIVPENLLGKNVNCISGNFFLI